MAVKSSYELHHHFPKLAEESGFAFNIHRPRSRVDWSKIRNIDIENLVRDRKFVIIEQNIGEILNCVLESEFDVRILDEGVLKMFRLAQLAVEYQQFCRHYLDRSVYVLREEITGIAQDLNTTKRELHDKEEELRRLKKKTKHTYRTPLPYGNDNIATMILKTLTNKGDIFPTTSNGDPQHNKCTYCDKIFLNQLYLKSHIARRHPHAIELPQKDIADEVPGNYNENSKLHDEIMELKNKLKEMENAITKKSQENEVSNDVANVNIVDVKDHKTSTKDVEVSTNNEDYLLDKIEEWKKEEHDKYNTEINLLRAQIMEMISSFKEKDDKIPTQEEMQLTNQLQVKIHQQGAEIIALRQELNTSKSILEKEELERKKDLDAKMAYWTQHAETQNKQYEALLEQMRNMAQEVQESRALAEGERIRATQLQALLQQNVSRNTNADDVPVKPQVSVKTNGFKTPSKKKVSRPQTQTDRKTLENLHRKAQELLNIRSSTSDDSSESIEKVTQMKKIISKKVDGPSKEINQIQDMYKGKIQRQTSVFTNHETIGNHVKAEVVPPKIVKNQEKKKKDKSSGLANSITRKVKESPIRGPGSPAKVLRAKITEEVNSRLVSIGVDPLKTRLPGNVFQKQKMQLQDHHESKSKRNQSYRKVKHSILAYLDSNLPSATNNETVGFEEYTSPTKISKTFSLTSVLSNVKSKALSLVKSNDMNLKVKRNSLNAEVAKKAMSLLKKPVASSPSQRAKITTESRLKSLTSSSNDLKHNPLLKNRSESEPSALDVDKSSRKEFKSKPPSVTTSESEDTSESDHKYYNPTSMQQTSNSIDTLIKSPARRPSSAGSEGNGSLRKLHEPKLIKSQSDINLIENKSKLNDYTTKNIKTDDSSDEDPSLDTNLKKTKSEENILSALPKQTKSVLKNASSTSSLNKKKVLFDMEAIQMKSVSASPSQSISARSDGNEQFESGLINLDDEDWEISSIENEPLKNDTKIQLHTRTSPKIAELKHTIESQLARRNENPTNALFGGVDVLSGPLGKATSLAGSNTSLGSSILDESETVPAVNNTNAFVKRKKVIEKDDSDIDISEYSLNIVNKKEESF